MRRRILTAVLAAALLFGGCRGGVIQEYSDGTGPEQSGASAFVPSSDPGDTGPAERSAGMDYLPTGVMNPLTGQDCLPDYMSRTRPVAVVINNFRAALPQNGITAADLVFECEAEGGITRLLAFYADWENAPVIGSIREARLHFYKLAKMFDSIMLCFGMNDETAAALAADKYPVLNGMRYADNILTYRDEKLRQTRNTEHTVMTTGGMISGAVAARSMRTALSPEAGETFFDFAPDGEIVKFSSKAKKVFLPVGMDAEYQYDAGSGLYMRSVNGKEQLDLNDGKQVGVTNALVLFTKQYADPADPQLVTVELKAGEGRYFTMGTCCSLYWQADAVTGAIRLYDSKGYGLVLNQGRTWINIISSELSDSVVWTEIG